MLTRSKSLLIAFCFIACSASGCTQSSSNSDTTSSVRNFGVDFKDTSNADFNELHILVYGKNDNYGYELHFNDGTVSKFLHDKTTDRDVPKDLTKEEKAYLDSLIKNKPDNINDLAKYFDVNYDVKTLQFSSIDPFDDSGCQFSADFSGKHPLSGLSLDDKLSTSGEIVVSTLSLEKTKKLQGNCYIDLNFDNDISIRLNPIYNESDENCTAEGSCGVASCDTNCSEGDCADEE